MQNVLTKEFLTYDGSTAAVHSTRIDQGQSDPAKVFCMYKGSMWWYIRIFINYAGNFHLFNTGIGIGRTLQMFADSSVRMGLNNNLVLELENDTFGSDDTEDQMMMRNCSACSSSCRLLAGSIVY